jgi:hypothetical protein
MSLTREQILAPRKPVTEPVPAPELGEGVTLTVRRLTAREFMALSTKVKADAEMAYAHWITATVVDDDGKSVFTPDDAAALAEQDATLIERLTEAAMRLNVNPKDKAKGNSQTPTADSSTPSR